MAARQVAFKRVGSFTDSTIKAKLDPKVDSKWRATARNRKPSAWPEVAYWSCAGVEKVGDPTRDVMDLVD